MTDPSPIVYGEWDKFECRALQGVAGPLNLRIGGEPDGPSVLFNHSILTSSAIWHRQALLLAGRGYQVICLDTRGHGLSPPNPGAYSMSDLVADNIAVLDGLEIAKVHFVGVSQGGMTGLGLAINHPDRLASLCVVAARADSPAEFALGWDERMALVATGGTGALADATVARWFGESFLQDHPDRAEALLRCIGQTSREGFIGCARAIQGLDYLPHIGRISCKVTLCIGSRDTALLAPMQDMAKRLPSASYEVIPGAGHLPQLDRPEAMDAILLQHLGEDALC